MGLLTKYFNTKLVLSGSDKIPVSAGDQYHNQDRIRDFWHMKEYINANVNSIYRKKNIVTKGLKVSQVGTSNGISYTAGELIVKYNVELPDDWSSYPDPPLTDNFDLPIMLVINSSSYFVPFVIQDSTTKHYVKIKYIETETSLREKTKTTGSYYSEITPSHLMTVDTTPPTDYETAIAVFTADGSNVFTFLQEEPRYKKYVNVTSNYTIDDTVELVIGDGTFNINLTSLSNDENVDRIIMIKNMGTGTLTVLPNGSDLIDCDGSLQVGEKQSYILRGNKTCWIIIASNTLSVSDVGQVIWLAHGSIPVNYILADGSAISRTTYSALFSKMGTTWGVGDGSTTFNIPNLQGITLSGDGSQSINGRTKGGFTLGTYAEDKFQGHYQQNYVTNTATNGTTGIKGGGDYSPVLATNVDVRNPVTDGVNGAPRTGAETRMSSAVGKFIIKVL